MPASNQRPWPGWLAELVVVAWALVVLHKLVIGGMPVSDDHPAHLFHAWQLWAERLPLLELRGWSSLWFAGYPAGELYPIGTSVWICCVRALTLGLLDWEGTYAFAFAAFFALGAWVVCRSGRLVGGPSRGSWLGWPGPSMPANATPEKEAGPMSSSTACGGKRWGRCWASSPC